ncbi:MAG: primosomal protein N' [Deltaproteobacteria bacterium]|nr:primosomal protein N' [Deltaproteobacteria bacterium]
MSFAHVAVPARVFHPFTYSLPIDTPVSPGCRVVVPFHRRHLIGVVLEILPTGPKDVSPGKIKPVEQVLDHSPLFSPPLLELIRWMAHYYCAPIGEVFRAALPKRLMTLASPKTTRPTAPHELTAFRSEAPKPTLTQEQQSAVDKILQGETSNPFLLHGITGSGKTEIYLRVFEEVTMRGGQSLLLVPEIGLTPQLTSRVVARFGNRVAVYHSGLTDAQRHFEWERIRKGDVDVVVGTRSALFTPLPNLKAIVVDEEHDSSYKQEDGFLYHGRDAAVMRGKLEQAIVVLGSATPSFESFSNAKSGKYHYLQLLRRATGAQMPSVEVIDIRKRHTKDAPKEGVALSPELIELIEKNLDRQEQTLLFLNRRGFARALICEACGFIFRCPNCNIALTKHLRLQKLACHYCEYALSTPSACAQCRSEELTPVGSGTERLEAELQDFFPKARIARIDSDTMEKSGVRTKIFRDMHDGKIDILVGTQVITKGHDFPNVTLVGIISADSSLHFPDFRSPERTFQLISQVAGRAGRASKPGRVVIQAFQPEHFCLQFARDHDYQSFFDHETATREMLGYPPFSRLVNVRFSGSREDRVIATAEQVAGMIRDWVGTAKSVSILGPAAAPLEKVRNQYRWQLLIKSSRSAPLSALLTRLPHQTQLPPGVRMAIDVDPLQFL